MARNNNSAERVAHIQGKYVLKGALITGAIGLVIALIGLFGGVSPKKSSGTSIVQKENAAPSNAAGGDGVQSNGNGSAVKANGPVTITTIVGDTSKHRAGDKGGGGPKYDVHVQNPSGGINGVINAKTINYIQITAKNVTLVLVAQDSAMVADTTYSCIIDTVRKEIVMRPKTGTWASPMIAILEGEEKMVDPVFMPASGKTVTVQSGAYSIHGKPYFGIIAMSVPATPRAPYTLSYGTLPSEIVFGNANGPLFSARLK